MSVGQGREVLGWVEIGGEERGARQGFRKGEARGVIIEIRPGIVGFAKLEKRNQNNQSKRVQRGTIRGWVGRPLVGSWSVWGCIHGMGSFLDLIQR